MPSSCFVAHWLGSSEPTGCVCYPRELLASMLPCSPDSFAGTGYDTNPMAMEACRANTIFTNVAMTEEGDVWWDGMTSEARFFPKSKLSLRGCFRSRCLPIFIFIFCNLFRLLLPANAPSPSQVPHRMEDWLRREWHADTHDKKAAAHPNSRFCCPAAQCPIIDPAWEDPEGSWHGWDCVKIRPLAHCLLPTR